MFSKKILLLVVLSGMAVQAFASDDSYIVQRGIVGKAEGDDVYILSANLIDDNSEITITDTQGSNSIQLTGGLSITSSKVASDSALLTLSNGAQLTFLGASSLALRRFMWICLIVVVSLLDSQSGKSY